MVSSWRLFKNFWWPRGRCWILWQFFFHMSWLLFYFATPFWPAVFYAFRSRASKQQQRGVFLRLKGHRPNNPKVNRKPPKKPESLLDPEKLHFLPCTILHVQIELPQFHFANGLPIFKATYPKSTSTGSLTPGPLGLCPLCRGQVGIMYIQNGRQRMSRACLSLSFFSLFFCVCYLTFW